MREAINPARLAMLFRKEFQLCNVQRGETIVLLSDLGARRDYVSAAESGRDGIEKYLATYVNGSEEDYREAVGAGRLAELAGWSQSVTGWQELFQ